MCTVTWCATSTNLFVRTPRFVTLLYNCARYLYEVSDYDLCLRLTDTATLACVDKDSLQFADICSAAGSAYYELNRLDACRKQWELYMRIQEEKLQERDLEVSRR